jgi:hypothetical protein
MVRQLSASARTVAILARATGSTSVWGAANSFS